MIKTVIIKAFSPRLHHSNSTWRVEEKQIILRKWRELKKVWRKSRKITQQENVIYSLAK